jgi:tRNA-specific 2-thiouridylase
MSGGVDSAVAALLGVRDGTARAGLTLRLSDAEGVAPGRCCAVSDVRDARRVAAGLSLPHYVIDLRETFERTVMRPFVEAYLAGTTPVPCVACNDVVKFDELLQQARALGARRVATGHYARIEREGDGSLRLLRARDRSRDQSYFLHGLSQEQLAAASFPLGELAKDEVRRLAREAGILVADKPDSQEICFVPDGDVAGFVERRAGEMGLPTQPGELRDTAGVLRGHHAGVHRFTVGQRRGLGALGAPAYVLELRAAAAEVVVGRDEDLLRREVFVERFRWVAGAPPRGTLSAAIRVRHGAREVAAVLEPQGDSVTARLREPVRAPAPGQYLVAYDGETCLGGGAITGAG